MKMELNVLADRFLGEKAGASFEQLLAPISPEHPAGEYLRVNGGYEAIREARREDDPSLPQGSWQHELKRADWPLVVRLCTRALAERSKDMQLVAWLMEAMIHMHGFSALAPCLELMHRLCERYWDSLHPCLEGDENHESRANIILWINTNLLPQLRQVSIARGGDGREFNWCDWELAHRYDQSRSAGRRGEVEGELSMSTLMAALAVTPGDDIQERQSALVAALAALFELGKTLDGLYTQEAPGFSQLRELLSGIKSILEGELAKRGRRLPQPDSEPEQQEFQDALDDDAPSLLLRAMADRAEAYACLESVADFLMRLEPHSPVPYLLHRAVEWGSLNTAELYQEIFVRMNGQISIFDLLGLKDEGRGR